MNIQLGWIPVERTVSLDGDVEATDAITIDVRLLPILDPATLGELLREELAAAGWTRREDGALDRTFGRATATLPPGDATITLAIEAGTQVNVQATESGAAPEDDVAAQDAIGTRAQRTAERKLAAASRAARGVLERKNAAELLEVEPALRKDVDDAIRAATKRALERRAASLGDVESVAERTTEDGYELTIAVRT